MACGDMTPSNRRAWTWGYLTALRMIRELKKQHGLSWQQAVTEAGKMLTSLVAEQWPGSEIEGLSVKGVEHEHGG